MRWILYAIIGATYALTLSVRFERASWMPSATIMEQVALYLTPILLVALAILGLRPATNAVGRGRIAIAIVLALGSLMLALLPGFQ
jgi:hypothetical protein